MMERRRSAMYFAVWAVGGASLAASAWFLSFADIPRFPLGDGGFWAVVWSDRLRLLAFLGPLAIGLPISWRAEKQLERGYRDDRWSEVELARVRAFVASPIWKWASLVVLISCLFALGFHSWAMSRGSFIYILLFPTNIVTRISRLLTSPVRNKGGLRDWHSFKPIHSDHWGEANHREDRLLPS